jgi:UDP-N-acetylglucosamine pyrophosphorylase
MSLNNNNFDNIKSELIRLNQEHILTKDFSEQHPLCKEIIKFNILDSIKHFDSASKSVSKINTNYSNSLHHSESKIQPIGNVISWEDEEEYEKTRLRQLGIDAIQSNLCAAVIMSGGQGTRLGFDGPKGT